VTEQQDVGVADIRAAQRPYMGLLAVGKMGPMFGEATSRLPRLGPRRAVVETPEHRGLRAAIVELGGLPDDEDDDFPPPPSFRRRARRGPAIPRELGTQSQDVAYRVATTCPDAGEERTDVGLAGRPSGESAGLPTFGSTGPLPRGVVKPPEWTPGRARVPGTARSPSKELAGKCRVGGLPHPQLDFVWDVDRGWTFDLAWPQPRLAVVFDGGARAGVRGVPGAGWIRDSARLNEAAIEGWSVLRLTPAQVADGSAYALVARALTSPWRRV
jgi:hypothetical protein